MGDFNLPVESVIWQQYWSSFEDAFSAAGNGWGFTRINGWIRVRIDHVLLDDRLKAVGARVGADWGSDHLPLQAEVQWR
jgi:endonuclease/exonuclease/phosphatase family metal-dependent hydrolase